MTAASRDPDCLPPRRSFPLAPLFALWRFYRARFATASRGKGRAHRVFHPLCGVTPDTLLRLLLRGGISLRRAHVLVVIVLMLVVRLPFTVGEAVFTTFLVRRRGYGPAPVFVIGHWRSGTTHLSNVLSRSPALGILPPIAVGLPAEALSFAQLVRPLIEAFYPPTRLIDDIPLRSDLPQEDELAMANLCELSCNHGLYFPSRLRAEFERGVFGIGVSAAERRRWGRRLRRYVARMSFLSGGRPLLIRNPANSARIPELLALWPDARFIHIHRDPVAVCASTIAMTETLVRELSLGDTACDAATLVRNVHPRLMARLLADTATLPPGQLVEVAYDDFVADPMAELDRIHRILAIPGFAAAAPDFRRYLSATANYRPRPVRTDWIDAAWLAAAAPAFGRWGYALPSAAPSAVLAAE
ncbi:MAG: sulfotransferase [Gluconacetobacter diazotrophicus]|nr:sulfotransferase [Gluconacetobacter diazotrophicus]